MTAKPQQQISTASALRGRGQRFARRGMWMILLLAALSAIGPALVQGHVLGVGHAVLLTATVFAIVFLAILSDDLIQDGVEAQAHDLGILADLHATAADAIALLTPPAPSIRPAPPAPRIRARAIADLNLTPRIVAQRPVTRRV